MHVESHSVTHDRRHWNSTNRSIQLSFDVDSVLCHFFIKFCLASSILWLVSALTLSLFLFPSFTCHRILLSLTLSVSLTVCTYTHMYICIYTFVYSMYIYIHIYRHVHIIHTEKHIYTLYTHIYMYVHISLSLSFSLILPPSDFRSLFSPSLSIHLSVFLSVLCVRPSIHSSTHCAPFRMRLHLKRQPQ